MPGTQVTMPDPRCPLCHGRMEAVQLKLEQGQLNEVWTCDGCRANHIFPARIDFVKKVLDSVTQFERSSRVLHLPRGVK